MPDWNLWIDYFPWVCNYESTDGGKVIENSIKGGPSTSDEGANNSTDSDQPIFEPTNVDDGNKD